MQTFSCSKKIENIVLSAGRYRVSLWGAQGGRCVYYSKNGGKGAHASATFTFDKQRRVSIIVGCQGETFEGISKAGGGGGGGSFIYIGSNLICAAGGGGGAGQEDGCPGESTRNGTSLYASGGINGEGGNPGQKEYDAGAGGAGFYSDGKIHPSSSHTGGKCPANGGYGGNRNTNHQYSSNGGFGGGGSSLSYYAPGGGGGYSGGAGGSYGYTKGGGGGSFTTETGVTHSGSSTYGRTGNGSIEIEFLFSTKQIIVVKCKHQIHIVIYILSTQYSSHQ